MLNYNSSSSFYPIGHPLPDFVYKVCKITPGKWNKITLQDVREHNEKVLKYYKENKKEITNHIDNYVYLHENTTPIKYTFENLKKIVFHNEDSLLNNETSELEKRFEGSLARFYYAVKPSFLATRIFANQFEESEPLSKILEEMKEGQYSLRGIHPQSSSFLHGLSHDLKNLFYDGYIAGSDFLCPGKLEIVEGLEDKETIQIQLEEKQALRKKRQAEVTVTVIKNPKPDENKDNETKTNSVLPTSNTNNKNQDVIANTNNKNQDETDAQEINADKELQFMLQDMKDKLKLKNKDLHTTNPNPNDNSVPSSIEDTNKDKDSQALLKEITDEVEKIKQKQDETNAKAINDGVSNTVKDTNQELCSKQTMEIFEQGQILYELAKSIPCCNDIIKEN